MSNRRALAAILGFALLFSFAMGLGFVKAESTFLVLMDHVHIESPTNRTYTSDSLTLNVVFGGLCFNSIQHSLTYSLDGKDMGAMLIVPHYPNYLSAQASFTASAQLPQLSKGQHIITVYAQHTIFNFTINGIFHPEITQQDNSTIIFDISDTIPVNELTPPTISNFMVENKTYPSTMLLFSFDVDKAVMSTSYCLDNITIPITDWWDTPASERTFNITLKGLTEGSHTLAAYAEDTFGNFGASANVYFSVDTTAPNVLILSIENKTYDSANVPLDVAVNESVSSIAYSLDGKENVSISGNLTISGLSNGVHNVTVYAWDYAGNTGTSKIINFTVVVPFPIVPVAVVSIVAVALVTFAGILVYHKKTQTQNSPFPKLD